MALAHVDFFSTSMGTASAIDVILPEGAQGVGVSASGEWEDTPVPVLYLLHGTSDDHTIWQRRTSIERYVAGRRLAVVMPNAHLSAYANQRYGRPYFDYLTKELPEVLFRLFRISRERRDNFAAGLSMGGYGALKLGLRAPERFAAVAGLSSGVDRLSHLPRAYQDIASIAEVEAMKDDLDPLLYQQLIQFCLNFGSPADFQADRLENLFLLAEDAASKDLPKIYMACGTEDTLAYEANQRFLKHLDALHIPYLWEEGPGVHEWGVWDHFIQNVLDWLPLDK